ncbi:MAG: hypothetical protein JWO00_510 [Candidatus Parcubacteria bacterium]|nr:hypothetical protein [Candidatus Parcubacteria bacterium]
MKKSTKPERTAIVTGGAGFIGVHLVKALADEGYDVHVIDNLISGKKEAVDRRATLHVVDITDLKALKEVFEAVPEVDFVFHLACRPRVQFSIDFPRETNDVNITGTLNMLVAARDAGAKRVVYSASSSAYGDQPTLPLVETMPTAPQSPYGLQKYVGELYTKMFSSVYGLPTVSLRYFNVYGPGQDPNGSYAQAIPKFLDQKKLGVPITITGDGEQRRDCTHVSDVVRANILAATSPNVGKGEAINIGGGKDYSMNEVAKLIGGPVQYIPARLEPRNTRAGVALAKKLLGWEPKVSLEQGLAELKKLLKIS